MAAAGTVNMVRIMTAAVVLRRAGLRISFRNFDGMFIDMALMWMMEMPIVQIIDVVAVLHASMPAVWAVFVLMVWMGLTLIFGHSRCSPHHAVIYRWSFLQHARWHFVKTDHMFI